MLIDKTKIYKITKFDNKSFNEDIVKLNKSEIKLFNFVLRKHDVKYKLKDYCRTFNTKEDLFNYYYNSNKYYYQGDKVYVKPSIEISFINNSFISLHFNSMKELDMKYHELLNKLNKSEYKFISID